MAGKAIFLDRDNTLIEDPGYINDPEQVKLLDGVAESLAAFRTMGYRLIVVSNQSGIARGIISEQAITEIHDRLRALLAAKGTFLDKIYYCPYHPDGVIPKYRRESNDRKPNPGMFLTAAAEMDIDLSQSWAIGDSDRDIEAGIKAGCKTILLDKPSHEKPVVFGGISPDYRAVNLKEAVNIVKMCQRTVRESATHVETTPQMEPSPEIEPQEEAEPETLPIQTAVIEVPLPVEQPPAIEPMTKPEHNEQTVGTERVEQLLHNIAEHLKHLRRDEMFAEFSGLRLIAGLVQIIALFCLLVGVWLLLSPARNDNSVLIAVGFAGVLQLMALTLYVMRGQK